MGYRHLILAGMLTGALMSPLRATTPEEKGVVHERSDLWEETWQSADEVWRRTVEALRPGPAAGGFARLWDDIMPRLDETLVLSDRHASLPNRAWFGEDRASNQLAINDLLDEAAAILAASPSQGYRARIRELKLAMREARTEIAEYRRRRVSAPRNAVWQKTVADYDAAIAEREARIGEYRDELQVLHRSYVADLEALGLDISEEQLEFLLSTVVGDDLIGMGTAFHNVKAITVQLERLTEESGEDLTAARRYYGMYTILLRVLERMHGRLIQDVDERYLPEIQAIVRRTRDLLAETRGLQRREAGRREILAANLDAQRFTLRAAGDYQDYLLEQRGQVASARRQLARDIAVARNTYETVKVAGDLVGLMQAGQRLLENLRSLEVPALRTFENLEMKREFEQLTLRLEGRPSG